MVVVQILAGNSPENSGKFTRYNFVGMLQTGTQLNFRRYRSENILEMLLFGK
jgi:hypothetical protein